MYYPQLDLQKIVMQAQNVVYDPKRFASVIIRMKDPKAMVSIFASGKMVCTGAKSEAMSELAARKCAQSILKMGFDVKFREFKIQNIVVNCDVEGLACANSGVTSYEPEVFPGLRYSMKEPKVTLLVFMSGKVGITGAKCREDMHKAFELIYPVLTELVSDCLQRI